MYIVHEPAGRVNHITCHNKNRNQEKMKSDSRFTTKKKLSVRFLTVFTITLGITAMVTFLWSLIGYGEGAVDWETSFRFAVIFGVILTWVKSWETREK